MNLKNKKIAIVHDFLVDFGGAERVLEVLCEMFPEAPIYTLLYDKEKMRGKFSSKEIHTSFLQKFPRFLRKQKKWLLPLMPVAPEIFDLRDFDIVISSSGAWSKGIVTRLNTIHISYVHSPMRFVWDANEEYLRQNQISSAVADKFQNFFTRILLNYIRVWDKVAADRPDYLIANSKYTQSRIKKYYGRESVVIYPPVTVIASEDVNDNSQRSAAIPMQQSAKQDISSSELNNEIATVVRGELPRNDKYFLVVSRLSPYKKIDMVVEAFNKLGLPLVVIGEGQQEKYLRKIARENVKIMGWQSDEKTAKYYAGARAFIFAGVDDFGMAPVEAMAYGVPVLVICKGGALEIVEEGKTGEFFDAATPEVIADGVRRLMENEKDYKIEDIKNKAQEFSKQQFIDNFKEALYNIEK